MFDLKCQCLACQTPKWKRHKTESLKAWHLQPILNNLYLILLGELSNSFVAIEMIDDDNIAKLFIAWRSCSASRSLRTNRVVLR